MRGRHRGCEGDSAVPQPRRPTPELLWHLSEDDALALLGTLSLLHRRLDTAAVPGRLGSTG